MKEPYLLLLQNYRSLVLLGKIVTVFSQFTLEAAQEILLNLFRALQ